ncbi:cellulose biosynthesis cyclic di-GMP-binding regulatory protein BcsB [Salipiger mucosus]|uniref:Cyclic di-GMP-binding protein n=1 Tax=Salipiger mucosus DSM 16094 TaxID=1123237 RepID=S9RC29_9RHOB|nr:cellulose biosynthesis cyclic di-GMP-binding regulatory protein BcsB [Salipiger mucosus]EPX75655.1 Cyclic di-GMP binding protein precursor [Salipiger mucosus DSM 16094]
MTALLRTFMAILAATTVWTVFSGATAEAQVIQLDELPGTERPLMEHTDEVSDRLATDHQSRHASSEPQTSGPEARPDVLLPLRALHPQSGETARYRLGGEFDEARFVLFVPNTSVDSTLRLSTFSTVNVLPEQSRIDVLVNGTEVGVIIPENFNAFRTAELSLPPGVLKEGRNVVSLKARHTHRVSCGPEAGFSLWTEVALERSGVTLAAASLDADILGFLSAVSAQTARGQPISLRAGEDVELQDSATKIIARISKALGGIPPSLALEGYYTTEAALPELARVTSLPEGMVLEDGFEIRRGGDGAIVLLVEHDAHDVAGQALLDTLPDSDIEALPPQLSPGTPIRLADLDQETIEGRGHYIREALDFSLPLDWLVLASQKARMRLLYRFDTSLPEGSLLLVKVNDTTVRLLPLDQAGDAGRPLPVLPVDFDAALLTPGLNRIIFEALIPGDPPDRACDLRDDPVFEISDRTTLFVPDSPSMSVTGIERVLTHLQPSDLEVSERAAARLPAGLLPQLAAIYNGAQGPDAAETGESYRLTIGTLQDIPQVTGGLVTAHLPAFREILTTPTGTAANGTGNSPSEIRFGSMNAPSWRLSLPDRLGDLRGRLESWVEVLWYGDTPKFGEWLHDRRAEALLLQPNPDRPRDAWLILGPDADPQTIVASLARATWSPEGPRGQVSAYRAETGWQSWTSHSRNVVLHEPITYKNLQAVLGNFASAQPWAFIVVIMAFTLCSAFVGMIIAALAQRRDR